MNKRILTRRVTMTWIVLLTLCLWVGVNPAVADIQTIYYHNDALGSPVAATDEQGNVLWREDYQPFGERLRKEDDGTNQIWYTGKPHEATFGLSYFGARWYDPVVGRFMGVDPAEVKPENIHSFNRYAYANNNPYKYVDPDGNEPISSQKGVYPGSSVKFPSLLTRAQQGPVRARPQQVVNALRSFRSVSVRAGNNTFKIDRKAMTHILSRHHPRYWDGSTRKQQTFFSKNLGPKEISNMIRHIMKSNRETLIQKGTNSIFPIRGKVLGKEYIVGINRGRVGQFYPVKNQASIK